VRFAVATPGEHAITVRALAPLNAAADPDVRLHIGAGQVLVSEEPKPPLCVANSPQECVETFNPILPAGEHVLEVYEWTNTNSLSDPEPPIGRTCFAVTVTR
jgi:hypothetical protein